MGSKLELPQGEHQLLAQLIEGIINGNQSLFPYPDRVEKLAQNYASQLIRRLSTPEDD